MTQQIPDEIKKLAADPKIYDIIEKIGNQFDLHIDQMGELDAEVRRIMLGLSKSSDFVKNISGLLEIDDGKSKKIAEKINADLFQTIKTGMQSQTSLNQPSSISSFEQAGNFTVELEQGSNNVDQSAHPLEGHDELIAKIENPPPVETRPSSSTSAKPETHTDLLVDHLLSGPVAAVQQQVVQKTPETKPAPAPAPKKPSGPDLYREPIN